MQGGIDLQDLQEEVVLCPNCKEEVPRTLYCLNCGYALYKEEHEVEPTEITKEVTPEKEHAVTVEAGTVPEPAFEETIELKPVEEVVEKVVETPVETTVEEPTHVEEAVEITVEEPTPEAAVEPAVEELKPDEEVIETAVEELKAVEEVVEKVVEAVIEEPTPIEEPAVIPESNVEVIETPATPAEQIEIKAEEATLQPEEEVVDTVKPVETPAQIEAPPECVEQTPEKEECIGETAEKEVVQEIHEEPVTIEAQKEQVVEETVQQPIFEAPEVAVVEEVVQPPSPAPVLQLEPDPVVKDTMEHLSKNTLLKLKLMKLLQSGDVTESTFKRIFDNYAMDGERLMNRRSEMLEKNRYDVEMMEKRLAEVNTKFEELRIRKAIGDISEDEYSAKAPSYEWDVRSLDGKLDQKKIDIEYLLNLSHVMPREETAQMKEISECCSIELDQLVNNGRVGAETASRIRATVEETIELIKGTGC